MIKQKSIYVLPTSILQRLITYLIPLVCIVIISSPTFSIKTPRPFTYDARIRGVTYNPYDIVQVDTVVGIATHIVLEEGEQYVTHAFGDAEGWAFSNQDNHYFIKPKDEDADTNLTIVTDRRTYYFRLKYHESNDSQADNKAMYGIVFLYPDQDRKRTKEVARKGAIEQGFAGQFAGYNLSYTMSGDLDIAPINAWDSGEFTYFKFPANRDMPGIYMVDNDGLESIVNRNVTGEANNVIVVHKVNPKWVLRLGRRALAIFNEAYSPDGIANVTGTKSGAVKRLVKGGDK